MSSIRPAPPQVQNLSAVAKGRYSLLNQSLPICPVTVTGKTPTTGMTFAHNLNSGVVREFADGDPVQLPWGATLGDVVLSGCCSAATLVTTLGALADGEFFALAGEVYRRVMVEGEGNAPGVGNHWVHKLSTGAVTELADATAIEKRPGAPLEWILIN